MRTKISGFFVGACLLFGSITSFAEEAKSYEQLPITLSQEEDIRILITTLAETSPVALVFIKSKLEAIGERINGLHPLRYIGFIYADPQLKACMPKLLKKAIVATRFVDELSVGLDSMMAQGELMPYVSGFATSLKVQESQILPYFDEKNWKGLLNYLNNF